MNDSDLTASIKSEIESNPVLLYIKGEKEMPVCGYSMRVVDVFKQLDVPFETRNVLTDPVRLQALKQFSNWPTTPQVYIGGELIGGCDITMELFQNGDLAKLVEKFKG